MSNYDLCDKWCYCDRSSVPLSCIQCPIRRFKIYCLFTSGAVNSYNLETNERKINKMRLLMRKKKDLLEELGRKTSCSPEFIQQLLSKKFHQNTHHASSNQKIPFAQIENRFKNTPSEEVQQEVQEDEDDVFTRNLLVQLFGNEYEDTAKKQVTKKSSDGPDQTWVDDLYELYAAVAGPNKPEKQKNKTEEELKQLKYSYNELENEDMNQKENLSSDTQQQKMQQESLYSKQSKSKKNTLGNRKMKNKKKKEQKADTDLNSIHDSQRAVPHFFSLHDRRRLQKLPPGKALQILPKLATNLIREHRESDKQRAFMQLHEEAPSFKREYESRPVENTNLGNGDGEKK